MLSSHLTTAVATARTMNKISSTDSPASAHKTLNASTLSSSTTTSDSSSSAANLTNKLSSSFARTATLPRRFKEKFLNKSNQLNQIDSLAAQSVNSLTVSSSNSASLDEQQNQNQQQQPANELITNLNKLISKYFKTIKYLEQIINKEKYELIASSTTATLESVLDIHNLMLTFINLSNESKFKLCRDKINKSLASLIKWSDSLVMLDNNNLKETDKIVSTSKKLIKHLNKSIRNLIKYLQKQSECELIKSTSSYSSSSPPPPQSLSTLSSGSSSTSSLDKAASSSLSSTASSSLNNKTPETAAAEGVSSPNVTIATVIDERNGTKTTTILKKSFPNLNQSSLSLSSSSNNASHSYVTQTSTLTTTTTTTTNGNISFTQATTNSDLLINKNDMNTFLDLDRLVLELSEFSNASIQTPDNKTTTKATNTSFTNEQCDYIVSQFETFAKKFTSTNLRSDLNDSVSSTLNRSTFSGSTILSTDSSSMQQHRQKTLHSNKVFKHDLDQKLCVIEGIIKDLKKDEEEENEPKSIDLNEFKQIEKQIAENGRILTRLIDHKTLNKTDFIQTNLVVDDKPVDELLKSNHDPVRSFMSLFDSSSKTTSKTNSSESNTSKRERRRSLTSSESSSDSESDSSSCVLDTKPVDSVDEEEDDDGNMNPIIFGANCLNPQFLLIDDDDDDVDDLTTQAFQSTRDDDDNINDYKDTLLEQLDAAAETEIEEQEEEDLKMKKLIDDSISIRSYSLFPLKLDTEETTETCSRKKESTWSLVSSKSQDNHDSSDSSKVKVQEPEQRSIANVLDLLDVSHLLEYQTTNKQNPTHNILRGGHVDALIVLATTANTNVVSSAVSTKSKATIPLNSLNCNEHKGNFLFQEAFLTTYRTIIEPIDLVNKLIYRYRLFSKYASTKKTIISGNPNLSCKDVVGANLDDKFDLNRLKTNVKTNKLAASAARNSLALLVRVLDDLGNEMNEKISELFAEFVYELLVDNELQLARLLRKKLLVKLELKRGEQLVVKDSNKKSNGTGMDSVDSIPYSINTFTKRTNQSILDFKSIDLAQQITLIDLNLFLKIELSEVLLWSTKQSEKYSPNLIKFTEHFNKISYWARSRILEHDSIKEREKIVVKFLKIMKHLRKFNNFNSYLSILSAVDSGPIQRLDWPKSLTDNIKEFAALIDPKCGFKCLREAVAEAQPPCIPHIGLILQDLTILHIANSDYLPSGNCNFWKRWQQYNILERLRCFRRCDYNFKVDTKIQKFFNNFEDYFGEDAQYSLSEQLKPRSSNNKHH